jgi:heavy metal sensor kinase
VNPRSISFRLVAWYAGLLTVIFMILCALLFLDLRRFLEGDLRQAQLRRVHQIANTLLNRIPQLSEDDVAQQVKGWYDPEVNARFIRITRKDGKVVYRSGPPQDASFDPAQVPSAPSTRPLEFTRKIELPGDKTLLVVTSTFQQPGKPTYLVESGELLDPMETMLDHVFLQLTLGLPLAITTIAIAGYLLVHRALKPVEQMARAAEQITQHNLGERLPVSQSGDELERLSLSLNRMIARLDDAFQNSRRFLADASHELRTPLTILRGELEDLTDNPQLDREVRDRVAGLLEEVLRLTKIVEQLFLLSRLDAGEAQSECRPCDLADLVRSTAEQMNLLAEDKGISISGLAREPVFVEGDRARLKQVVVNLLDNAIKYTPRKGTIQWSVQRVNGHAVLEVADNGIGIPADALPRIFDRFYRVDAARSDDTESAGLGLSIVKSICTAHQAEVQVESAASGGSCFRVKLPAIKEHTQK